MRYRRVLIGVLVLLAAGAIAACDDAAVPAAPTAAATEVSTEPTAPPALRPTVAPATGEVAFIGADGALWLVEMDGSEERAVAAGPVRAAAWSPDGATLAYVVGPADDGTGQAMLYDVASGASRAFEQARPALARLSWSPDGRYLLLDCGTSPVRTLVVLEAATQGSVGALTAVGYAWSPDGKGLAYGQRQPVEPPLPYELGDSLSLAVFEPGQEPRVILEGTADVLYQPQAWLPDGRILCLRTDWPDKSQSPADSLWTVGIDGNAVDAQPAQDIPLAYDPQALLARLPAELRDSAGAFSWSGDGRWVAFQAGGYPDWGVYLFDTQTGDAPRRLASGTAPALRPVDGGD